MVVVGLSAKTSKPSAGSSSAVGIAELAAAGALGRKSGAGFYKKVDKAIFVFDSSAKDYRPQTEAPYASLAAASKARGPAGRIAAVISSEDAATGLSSRSIRPVPMSVPPALMSNKPESTSTIAVP